MNGAGRTTLGTGFAFVSAMVFALNVVLVPLIYEAGGNIHAVNLVRPVLFFLCVAAWLAAARGGLRLPVEPLAGAIALGGLMCLEFYAMHSAVKYIPVGLAVLVLYTYPLIVALASGLLGRGRITVWLLLVLVVTFLGLVLALGASPVALDWRGVGLGLLAAVGLCAIVMLGETTMEGYDNATVMFYVTLTASGIMVALTASGAGIVWPAVPEGFGFLFGSTLFYVIATSLLFISVTMIGPLRFAAIDNTAPVWATLFAIPVLGERLSLLQWLGVTLVVGGVISVQFLQSSGGSSDDAPEDPDIA